jgi:hypothetical protein
MPAMSVCGVVAVADGGWRELTAQEGIFAQVWEAGSWALAGDKRVRADGTGSRCACALMRPL